MRTGLGDFVDLGVVDFSEDRDGDGEISSESVEIATAGERDPFIVAAAGNCGSEGRASDLWTCSDRLFWGSEPSETLLG